MMENKLKPKLHLLTVCVSSLSLSACSLLATISGPEKQPPVSPTFQNEPLTSGGITPIEPLESVSGSVSSLDPIDENPFDDPPPDEPFIPVDPPIDGIIEQKPLPEANPTLVVTLPIKNPAVPAGNSTLAPEPLETPSINQTGLISQSFGGKIYDDSEVPVMGATVSAHSLNAVVPYEATTRTELNGAYLFENAPTGVQIELSVTKNGYSKQSRVVVLSRDTNGPANQNKFDFGSGSFSNGTGSHSNALKSLNLSNPKAISLVSFSETELQIEWEAVPGVQNYSIEINAQVFKSSQTAYKFTSLNPGKLYKIQVKSEGSKELPALANCYTQPETPGIGESIIYPHDITFHLLTTYPSSGTYQVYLNNQLLTKDDYRIPYGNKSIVVENLNPNTLYKIELSFQIDNPNKDPDRKNEPTSPKSTPLFIQTKTLN